MTTHYETIDLLKIRDNFPDPIVVGAHQYWILESLHIGEGISSVVWKARDEMERIRALKFCPKATYGYSHEREAFRAAQLEDCEAFARFVDMGVIELGIDGVGDVELIVFVEHFVDGETLEEFLCNNDITPSFMLAFVQGMCTGLNALRIMGLTHNDLHAGNVMIARPPLGDLSAERRIKIIDTGHIRSTETSFSSDHDWFVKLLVDVWNACRKKRMVVIRVRRFLESVIPILRSMLDEDNSVALRDPVQIKTQFEGAHARAMSPPRESIDGLKSPFEFISADHIADDRLLVEIFASSCPWLEKVAGPDPCLITGPRGCGKSTIFRWLSLKAHLHKPASDIFNELRIAGFYISCSSDLQNRLSWIRTEEDATNHRELIVHYFNLLAAREVLRTLALIAVLPESETVWGFTTVVERTLHNFISLNLLIEDAIIVRGISRTEQALEMVESEIFSVQLSIQRNETSKRGTTPSFLGDLSALLVKEMSVFSKLKITFLVDDFSTHRISEAVQRVLNQIIWERRSTHVFKLSSEKHGAVLTDELLASSEISRERLEIDCGQEYLALNDHSLNLKSVQFAKDLLDNRLKAAKFSGNTELLIGHSKYAESSLAKALASKETNPKPGHYHGIECIAQLCSGDVAGLLLVFNTIFTASKIDATTSTLVPAHIQDKSIVQVSRTLLDAIKTYFPFGEEMHQTVLAFGNLVRKILEKGRPQKDGDPTQAPRIEIDQPTGDVVVLLPPSLHQLALELVRRAIFIEMGPGLSRHNTRTTLRWNLRRIYLPAFRAALTKNDAIKQSPEWFTRFLDDPSLTCDQLWATWPKTEKGTPLFNNLKE